MKFLSTVFMVASLATYPSLASTSQEVPYMVTKNATAITHLIKQFAQCFTEKDSKGIGALLVEDFALFDPALKWLHGKATVVDVLQKQFVETDYVKYEVINTFEDGNTGILEFKITLDDLVLYGVDFIEFEGKKMKELRCYYNPPDAPK